MLGHQFAQKGQTIHARHLDIQGYHVRLLLCHPLRGQKGVGRTADNFYSGVFREDGGQGLADNSRVIDDQYLDSAFHASLLDLCPVDYRPHGAESMP